MCARTDTLDATFGLRLERAKHNKLTASLARRRRLSASASTHTLRPLARTNCRRKWLQFVRASMLFVAADHYYQSPVCLCPAGGEHNGHDARKLFLDGGQCETRALPIAHLSRVRELACKAFCQDTALAQTGRRKRCCAMRCEKRDRERANRMTTSIIRTLSCVVLYH